MKKVLHFITALLVSGFSAFSQVTVTITEPANDVYIYDDSTNLYFGISASGYDKALHHFEAKMIEDPNGVNTPTDVTSSVQTISDGDPATFSYTAASSFQKGEYSFFFQALDQVNAPAGGGVTTFHVISKPTISANTPAADATVVPNAAAVISVTIDDPDNSMATYTGTGLNPIIFVAPQGHGVQAKELTQVGSTNEYTATVDLSEEVLTNVEIAVRTGAADAVTINYSFTVSSATGLSTVNNNYFQFGPNPATDYLNFNSSNIKKVEFYNLTGALVKTEQENVDINISELSEGVYILHIYDKQGNVYTDRFLKQ